jgi:hypothetical protein
MSTSDYLRYVGLLGPDHNVCIQPIHQHFRRCLVDGWGGMNQAFPRDYASHARHQAPTHFRLRLLLLQWCQGLTKKLLYASYNDYVMVLTKRDPFAVPSCTIKSGIKGTSVSHQKEQRQQVGTRNVHMLLTSIRLFFFLESHKRILLLCGMKCKFWQILDLLFFLYRSSKSCLRHHCLTRGSLNRYLYTAAS